MYAAFTRLSNSGSRGRRFPAIIDNTRVSRCQHSLHRNADHRELFVGPVYHVNSCYLLILIIHMRLPKAPLITINDDISSRLQLIRPHQDVVVQGQPKHPGATKAQDVACTRDRMGLPCQTVLRTTNLRLVFRLSYQEHIQGVFWSDWVRSSAPQYNGQANP